MVISMERLAMDDDTTPEAAVPGLRLLRWLVTGLTATMIVGAGAAVLGVLSALSFNEIADFRPLGFIPLFAEANFFDALDGVTAELFMPIGAILTCIFVGWIADAKLIDDENGLDGLLHQTWRALVRYVCPIILAVILFFGIFG